MADDIGDFDFDSDPFFNPGAGEQASAGTTAAPDFLNDYDITSVTQVTGGSAASGQSSSDLLADYDITPSDTIQPNSNLPAAEKQLQQDFANQYEPKSSPIDPGIGTGGGADWSSLAKGATGAALAGVQAGIQAGTQNRGSPGSARPLNGAGPLAPGLSPSASSGSAGPTALQQHSASVAMSTGTKVAIGVAAVVAVGTVVGLGVALSGSGKRRRSGVAGI